MSNHVTLDHESLVDQLIAEYLLAEQASRAPQREAWLAAHPSVAAELAEFLDDRARFASAVRPIREAIVPGTVSGGDLPTIGLNSADWETDVPLEPATVIGDYRLIAEIARGGMGVVYKAHHERLNRTVALKMVLPDRLGAAADAERFYAEARAAAKLADPHIVPIYEIGEYRGRPFFSMQFVPGGSLREHLARFRTDPRAAARLIAIAARAVHHAHQRGILHRDLKPGNILLDEQGQPHVTDFGLAKRLDVGEPLTPGPSPPRGEGSDDGLTQAGGIVGTPSYMAPEQAAGKSDLTTAVDVYGLGAVLYELLTGQPPFRGKTPVETMMQAVVGDLPAPRTIDATIDPELEAICLMCLARDPARRYGTAAELADDLDRWLAGEPLTAKPATLVEQATKWSRRHPVLAGSFGLATILACCFLIAAGMSWWNAEARAQAVASLDEANAKLTKVNAEVKSAEQLVEEHRQEAEKQRKIAEEQRKIAEKQTQLAAAAEQKLQLLTKDLERAKDESEAAQKAAAGAIEQKDAAIAQAKKAGDTARHTLYAADLQLAHAAWQTENLLTAIDVLDRQRPGPGEADLRGFEWDYLWRLTHGERWTLTLAKNKQQAQPLAGLDVTLDGSTLAAADLGGTIKIWDLQTGVLLKTFVLDTGDKPAAAEPKFEQDPVAWAKTFFVGGRAKIVGVSFTRDGKSLRVTLRKDIGQDFMMKRVVPAFMNKDKPSLAMVAEQLEVRQIALDGMIPPTVEAFDPAAMASPLSPLLAGSCFLANNGEMMTISSLVASPNGKLLAMGGMAIDPRPGRGAGQAIMGGVVLVWNVETKSIVETYHTQGVGAGLVFSPDNATLAVGGPSGSVQLFAIGKEMPPREFPATGLQAMCVAFSSDGSRLASGEASGNARLWDVASGKELAVLRGQYGGIMRIDFAQGDTAIVCGGAEIKVWDLDHLPGRVNVAGHVGAVKSLAFSQDGKQLHAADTSGKFGTYEAATGQRLSGGSVSVTTPSTVAVSPRGSWFAASVKDGLLLHNTQTGAEHKLELPGQMVFTLAFSADEQFVSAGAITGELTVWKIEGQEKLPPVSGKGGFAFSQQFSPSGKQLAFNKEGLVQIYDLSEKTIFTPWTEKFSGMLTAVAYSPDGSLLAVGSTGLNSGDVRVYDLQARRERLKFTGAGRESMALAISPDNRRLAAVSHSNGMQSTVRLYELETGREVLSLPMPRGMCTALAFSPDGRRIATATMPSLDPLSFAQPGKTPAEIQIWEAPPARE